MSDSSDCEMPPDMDSGTFQEACKPWKRARATLARARTMGLGTVPRNLLKVRAAKAQVKELCREWQAAGAVCAICQERVADGFLLSCCGQRLHERCLISYAMPNRDTCLLCRRPWDVPLGQRILELCHESWRRTAPRSLREPIHLDDLRSSFHRRLPSLEAAELDDRHLELDGVGRYPLNALSFADDAIHCFVRRFLGGRWPERGRTVLRITARGGERQALRFRGFENRFWAEPVMLLEYGLEELAYEIVTLPLASITSAVAVNPWRADAELVADKLWVVLAQGQAPTVARCLGMQDDLVEPLVCFADPFSDERRVSPTSSILHMDGPVELTKPETRAYAQLGPMPVQRVCRLVLRMLDPTARYVRILGFHGDLIYGDCQSPFQGYVVLDAKDVLIVSVA